MVFKKKTAEETEEVEEEENIEQEETKQREEQEKSPTVNDVLVDHEVRIKNIEAALFRLKNI